MRKVAVVTGASRGIGREIACRLIKEGYRVYGLCRTVPEKKMGIRFVACDVSVKESVDKAFERILEREKQIHVLINNAGMGISGAVEFSSEEEIEKQLSVNLKGSVWCAQAVIPSMRTARWGKILFISSLGAIFPLPFQSFYSVSKAGLNAFSDALGIEMRPFHVSTCTVMLNDVKTEFTDYREKCFAGDGLYHGRIARSVGKMEASERKGMEPDRVAKEVVRLLGKRKLPSHVIVGASNQLLGLLNRLLPTEIVLRLLAVLYAS
ncbi:MAG: SDR family NAD(P)-dependent oxidoreductase [Lachnospiraceae bacterium]|jgi:short-subunit dehydrogenase|nr:SDR family NAD(P)-dependent oxidoreductase [Lachnospiraceae bacterium]